MSIIAKNKFVNKNKQKWTKTQRKLFSFVQPRANQESARAAWPLLLARQIQTARAAIAAGSAAQCC